MTDLALELEALRKQNEELRRRLDERHHIDVLRRALRGCETVEDVADKGVAYAMAELDGAPCVLLLDDPASSAFAVQAAAGLPVPLDDASRGIVVERDEDLAATLSTSSLLAHSVEKQIAALVPLEALLGSKELVLAGLHDGSELVGLLVVAGDPRLFDRLKEAAAELSSATAASLRERSRAEELALLEIQERELVGLLREVEQRDATIQEDLQQARQFQQLMMALPTVRGARIEAFYEPMGLVGGDVFAVSQLQDRVRIFIADATGHGVRASLTTMFIKSGYESLKHAPDPAVLLRDLNESIAGTYRSSEMLFSASCVDIVPETGRVTLACAGHPPACIVRGDKSTLVEGRGALMGVRSGMRYETVTTSLEPGDGLYLFTDGIADARADNGDFFGEERLYEMVRELHVRGESVATTVRDAIFQFVGSRGLADDVSLVGIRLDGLVRPHGELN